MKTEALPVAAKGADRVLVEVAGTSVAPRPGAVDAVQEPDAGHRADAFERLVAVIAAQSARPCPAALREVAETAAARFGDSLQAVLFYGSCLRAADPANGLVDIYVLVDDYRHAYAQRYLRYFNRVLPPNVFYMECPLGAHAAEERPSGAARLRIKCTVLSLAAFEHGTSRWFHSYLWGRFAQPVRIVRVCDADVRRRVNEALARAVLTLLRRTLPCLPPETFTAEALWTAALQRCYAAELRVEGCGRATQLVAASVADYQHRTRAGAPLLGLQPTGDGQYRRDPAITRRTVFLARCAWGVRRGQGRILSILRLVKSVNTFNGGVDYIVWKIERHSGVHIEVTPRLRRHPLIYGWGVLFRLLRKDVVK